MFEHRFALHRTWAVDIESILQFEQLIHDYHEEKVITAYDFLTNGNTIRLSVYIFSSVSPSDLLKFEFAQITQIWIYYLKSFSRVKSTQEEKALCFPRNELKLTLIELFSLFHSKSEHFCLYAAFLPNFYALWRFVFNHLNSMQLLQ